MTKKEIEFTVIRNAVSTLATLCAGSDIKIIDLLTGYLWDEEEAGGIKGPLNQVVATDKKPFCNLCAIDYKRRDVGQKHCGYCGEAFNR